MKNSTAKKVLGIILAGTMVFGMAACSGSSKEEGSSAVSGSSADASSEESGGNAAAADLSGDGEYYMITFQSGIDYWTGCYEGFERAAQAAGAKTVYTGSTDGDFAKEVDVLEQVIAKSPAGIAITCVDPDALSESINKAIEADIPVVTFDSDSPNSERMAYLGTGNENAGAEAAAFMAEQIGHEGKVALVYFAGSQNQEERAAGFEKYMEENEPNIEVVQRANGGETENEAASATSSLIQGNPDIKGLFACNAWTGLGVGTAVQEAGKTGDICVVAFDTDEGVLDYIESGVIQGSVVQGTQQMGYWAFQFLAAANHDYVIDGWAEKGLAAVPSTVDTGVSIVHAENLDSFR